MLFANYKLRNTDENDVTEERKQIATIANNKVHRTAN